MRNEMLGPLLRAYRKRSLMTVEDVSKKLKTEYGEKVAEKTIYGWESNQSHPSSDMFLALCKIYQIHDISAAFSDIHAPQKQLLITKEERYIIEHYRRQPELQHIVQRVLNVKIPKKARSSKDLEAVADAEQKKKIDES